MGTGRHGTRCLQEKSKASLQEGREPEVMRFVVSVMMKEDFGF
nr:MAG TPA: hypothetical protein [Caudoviricetes sp.]